MKKRMNVLSIILSVLVGLAVICSFAYITGSHYATALFPEMALLAGFIITGFIIGITSEGVTILEPGLGSVIVSVLSYFLIPFFGIKTFESIWLTDWILLYMNGILLSFVGAWLGEIMQYGELEQMAKIPLSWTWIIAGSITGLAISIFIVNLLTVIFGPNPSQFIIPYFSSLLVTGFIVGWKSPGVTIKEAGISGLITVTIVFDIVRLTLITETEIDWYYVVVGGLVGTVVSLIGGWFGELFQAYREKKLKANDKSRIAL